MTMIRINLIAEKKATAPKAVKKQASGGAQSELQENAILIVSFLVAVAIAMGITYFIKNEYKKVRAEELRLQAEWEEVKIWQERKENYEIRKELLNDQIAKISALKDSREGPVQLMTDVYNIMPDSVWLSDVRQGYKIDLVKPSKPSRKVTKLPGRNLGAEREYRLRGFASSPEAATTYANRLREMDATYKNVMLNDLERTEVEDNEEGPGAFLFHLYFELEPKSKSAAQGQGGS